jgi:fumarate reductase (CoM/CoB) subunit A
MNRRATAVDVLVVGGGLGALAAAVSASKVGAKVALAVKRQAGRSGSSAMTTGGYATVWPDSEYDDSHERHISDTLQSGAGMAEPELVEILCTEATDAAREILDVGGQFMADVDDDQRLYLAASGDHSVPRSLVAANRVGVDFTIPLTRAARDLGVELFEQTMVLELLVEGGHVRGAVTLDIPSNRIDAIAAGATILATGGAGRMFPVTSNPGDVTGDGFALAARAGAMLRDMEFIQFYPWRCIDPFDSSRVAVQPETFSLDARLYNADGERFMTAYDPERSEAATRDVAARAIFDQIRKGKDVGGGVRLDLSRLSHEELELTNPKIAREMERRGEDHRTYPFIVAPEAHYVMGGVEIDENGRSSLHGLYAVGEVSGGIHGANRLSNNSLPEAMVFGRRAGKHAARSAPNTTVDVEVPNLWRAVEAQLDGQDSTKEELAEFHRELRGIVGRSLGIVRTESGLLEGLEQVASMRRRLGDIQRRSGSDLRKHVELGFMLDTAEISLRTALARVESRGAHYRDDFPDVRDGWDISFRACGQPSENGLEFVIQPSRPLPPRATSRKVIQ